MTKCSKHPKYNGKKKPPYECWDCLQLYLTLQKPRTPIKATKIEKDKSKYDRKDKRWKEDY